MASHLDIKASHLDIKASHLGIKASHLGIKSGCATACHRLCKYTDTSCLSDHT